MCSAAAMLVKVKSTVLQEKKLLTSKVYFAPPPLVFFQCKFKPFYKYAKSFNSDDFDYEALEGSDYIFMRWKVSLFCSLKKPLSSISLHLSC